MRKLQPKQEPIIKRWEVTDATGHEYGKQGFLPDDYLYVKVDCLIDIQIKMETEGVVIDAYPIHVVDEPIETTYVLYTDDEEWEETLPANENSPFRVDDVYTKEYNTKEYNPDTEHLYIKVKNLSVQLQYIPQNKVLFITVTPLDSDQELSEISCDAKDFVTNS